MFLENKDLPWHSRAILWAVAFLILCAGLRLLGINEAIAAMAGRI